MELSNSPVCRTPTKRTMFYFRPVNSDDKQNNRYVCEINNCNREYCGKNKSNLKSHIRNFHGEFFQRNFADEKANARDWKTKQLKFKQDLAEMVAINGCTFRLLNSSGFQSLVEKQVDELAAAGHGDGLTKTNRRKTVSKHILHQASIIEEIIKAEVNDKFVAVMIDAASKNGKSFLGMTIQFIDDGVFKIRSLGIIESLHSHTAKNLMAAMLVRLKYFGIEERQIISITTDNERSMLAMVKQINKKDEETNGANFEFEGDTDQIPDNLFESDEHDDPVLDALLDDSVEFMELIKECLDDFAIRTTNIYGIRCAAHTLQLAIRDTLLATNCKTLISLFRNVVKFLRTPTNRRIMREQGIKITLPRLDCETRWSSMYRMVLLLLLRNIK